MECRGLQDRHACPLQHELYTQLFSSAPSIEVPCNGQKSPAVGEGYLPHGSDDIQPLRLGPAVCGNHGDSGRYPPLHPLSWL